MLREQWVTDSDSNYKLSQVKVVLWAGKVSARFPFNYSRERLIMRWNHNLWDNFHFDMLNRYNKLKRLNSFSACWAIGWNRPTTTKNFGSTHRGCSINKGALKHFSKFTKIRLCRNLCLDKFTGLKPATFLKRDSDTGGSLWILRNF